MSSIRALSSANSRCSGNWVVPRWFNVSYFEADLRVGHLPFTAEQARAELAGRDLACWCPLDQPCHADVLLEIANAASGPGLRGETK